VTPVLIFAVAAVLSLVAALIVRHTTNAARSTVPSAPDKPNTMTFPVDPCAGDEYQTSNGRWQFDGQAWRQK
jgi:hypothetical protein